LLRRPNDHPDHDTTAGFSVVLSRKSEARFARVLELAREMGLLPTQELP
jgi:hypothetical protein